MLFNFRWDSTRFNQHPDYFKFLYQFQLHTIQEFEQELTNQGKSHDLSYLKKEVCSTLIDPFFSFIFIQNVNFKFITP